MPTHLARRSKRIALALLLVLQRSRHFLGPAPTRPPPPPRRSSSSQPPLRWRPRPKRQQLQPAAAASPRLLRSNFSN